MLVTVAAAVAATVALGYLTLFSTFAPYDDEGYFLVTLKGYLSGARLYNDTYGPYGPFLFQALALSFKGLGLQISNDGARFVTLAYWILASGLLALGVYRITHRRLPALLVYPLAFRILTLAPNEPTAPGHLLVLLLAAMVAAAALFAEARPRLVMWLIGALGAAAFLTKINVGGLALISGIYAALMASPTFRRSQRLPWLATSVFALTPIVLMGRNLGSAPVRTYGLHVLLCAVALGVIAVVLMVPRLANGLPGSSRLCWLAGGAIALAIPALGAVLAQGTTLSALTHSLLLDAVKQPTAFSYSLALPDQALSVDVLSIVAAAVVAAGLYRAAPDRRLQLCGGAARLAAGLVVWYEVIGPRSSRALDLPAALAWVAAVPVSRDRRTQGEIFLRLFLPALAVLQTLHAYPVAGSQIAWSSFLFAAVGAVCIADGLHVIGPIPLSRIAVLAAAATLCIWVAVRTLVNPIHDANSAYKSGVPLRVNGASRIHVPASTASTYEWLAQSIHRRCSTFVSSPGLNSLYLMSRTTPPTWMNISDWLFDFDAKRQIQVVRRVNKARNLCAVRNPGVELFWARGKPIPRYALYRFITDDFRTVGSRGGFDLMVRRTG